MNISNINSEQCCGCTACQVICPHHAIVMCPDKEGFLYPKIIKNKCVDCGLCVSVCEKKIEKRQSVIGAFAAKNTMESVLLKSSSGGVSHAMCVEIIKKNGLVYGVTYDKNNRVVIEKGTTLGECEKFYGSKYVQANPLEVFSDIRENLKNDKTILFIATSCYVAGLLAYLEATKTDTLKLYTIDLICHGTPSPMLFDEYIKWINKKRDVLEFAFRTKEKPWGYGSKNYGCTIKYKSGRKEIDSLKSRVFLNLFFSNNCLRPYCHNCEYAGVNKPADLTIADFWGITEEHPEFYDKSGVSAVLVNSKKGLDLLKESEELVLLKSTIEKISKKQGNLNYSSPKSGFREEFWTDYDTKGFDLIAKKYGGYNFMGFIRQLKLYSFYSNIRNRK